MKQAAAPTSQDHAIEKSQKVLRVICRIMKGWGLKTVEEQTLMGVSKTTWHAWKGGNVRAPLDASAAERVSYILRIHAALGILIPIPERAAAWVKDANTAPLFGGNTALSRMLGGQVGDLMVVADYLDAQRGGDFA
jgi:hypothetical protein